MWKWSTFPLRQSRKLPLSWSPDSGHLPVLTQSTSSKCSTFPWMLRGAFRAIKVAMQEILARAQANNDVRVEVVPPAAEDASFQTCTRRHRCPTEVGGKAQVFRRRSLDRAPLSAACAEKAHTHQFVGSAINTITTARSGPHVPCPSCRWANCRQLDKLSKVHRWPQEQLPL